MRKQLSTHARSSRRRGWLGLASGVALSLAALATPSAAFADTGTIPTSLHGTTDLGTETVSATSGALSGSLAFSAGLTWDQGASISATWDPNNVRQGRDLDPTVAYTRPVPGAMSIHYSATGTLSIDTGSAFGVLSTSVTVSQDATGTCSLLGSGPDYTCHLESSGVKVVDPTIFGVGLPYVEVKMVSDVTITPQALHTLRTATAGLVSLGTNDLALGETPIVDPLHVGCRTGVGDALTYALGSLSTSDGIHVVSSVGLDVGAVLPNPITGVPGFYQSFYNDTIPVATTDTTAAMSGPGGSIAMGAIQANNVPPTLGPVSAPAGLEGSPIQFSTSATGPCAAGATYTWDFGDGSGAGHTATPRHIYADAGVYTGQVTVTDSTGLTDTQDFTVNVGNVAPNVSVIPGAPVTVAWGRPLTLQAQAVAPGAADQATLTYSWDFADGDSISNGGTSATHQWATPGTLHPSVTVCDEDGFCTTRSFTVNVRARATTLSYTGPQTGTYSATSGLAASLVDEFGQPVNAGPVTFSVDGSSVGTATTGATGAAGLSYVVSQPAGSHQVSASYAGSALYLPAGSGNQPFAVSAMATSVTYTGGLIGAPNKPVAVSAKVLDALGRPIAGAPVTFVIGSQSTTATTNASGVASGAIVLAQKPGYYPLTVSWPGAAGTYLGSGTSAQFSLNKK